MESEIILQEMQDLDNIIINTKELILKFPDDKLLILTLKQTENRKKYLLQEFEKSKLRSFLEGQIKYLEPFCCGNDYVFGKSNAFKSCLKILNGEVKSG
jgi:hypothetical protein